MTDAVANNPQTEVTESQPKLPWHLVLVFGFAIFASASLVFVVQPMTGKMLLPFVGGVPSGWVVAMAFFQTALLLGYLIAHLFAKLPPFQHGIAHLLLVAVAAISLPIALSADLVTEQVVQQPALSVITMLTIGVGLPFVALAATGPTLQRLFAANRYGGSRDPYFLYATSNIGSFVGLFAYPLVFEPTMGLDVQSLGWTIGYAALAASIVACLLMINRQAKAELIEGDEVAAPLSWQHRLTCIACAAIPSSLMLGVTTKITTDIASTPMIWVLPLGLYLITMIMAFSKKEFISKELIQAAHPLAVIMAVITTLQGQANTSLYFVILHLLAFTIVSMSVHNKLASMRPHPSRLTEYFLMLSLGGALGGVLTAFAAPFIFDWYWEYPIAMMLSLLLLATTVKGKTINRTLPIIGITSITLMMVILSVVGKLDPPLETMVTRAVMFVIAVTVMMVILTPRVLAICLAIIAISVEIKALVNPDVLQRDRNFFGILQVTDKLDENFSDTVPLRLMSHGSTIHGLQLMDGSEPPALLGYFHPEGPYGDVFRLLEDAKEVAVMGLGTGALGCKSAPGRNFVFYEIDPAVERMAREHFDFVSQCGNPEVKLGDGRLRLMADDGPFDLIVLDAFSSDAIPVHLMTQEAIEGYLTKLTPGGTIAFHISNRFVNLVPALTSVADAVGLTAVSIAYRPPEELTEAFPVDFVIMTDNRETIDTFVDNGWTEQPSGRPIRVWTDQYSNLLGSFIIFQGDLPSVQDQTNQTPEN